MANMYINAMTALWNNVGTVYSAIKMNVTDSESAASSKLIDLRVSDVNKFNVSKNGDVYAAGNIVAVGVLATGGAVLPTTGNTDALGSVSNPWSDLFLGSGAVVRWMVDGAIDMALAHTNPAILTLGGGDLRVLTAGAHAASVVTTAGTQTLTNKTITGGVITGSTTFTTLDPAIQIGPATATTASLGRPVPTASTVVMGGNSTAGGYLQLFGETHSTAKDYILASGSGGSYRFDNSANKHQFKNNAGTVLFEIGPGGITSITSVGNVDGQDFHAVRASAPTTGAIYLGNSGARYLYYNGTNYSMPGAPLIVGGDITTSGYVKSNSYFLSTDTACIVGTTGVGTVYLRPNGYAEDNNQLSINSSGNVTVSGSITTTGTQTINTGNLTMTGASNYLSMVDTTAPASTRHIHHNGGLIGFLDSGGNWAAYTNDAGDWVMTGYVTARGYECRAGISGATGNIFNFFWSAGATGLHAWIDATDVGEITLTSDYRAKRNVAPLAAQWDTVKSLRPVSFQWQDWSEPWGKEGEHQSLMTASDEPQWGFLAHELQETLVPSAATGVKDQKNSVQSPNPWTVIAALTTVVQEMQARIEQLEARA